MPVYTIFNQETGEPLRVVECPEEVAKNQVRPGEDFREGDHDWGQEMPTN